MSYVDRISWSKVRAAVDIVSCFTQYEKNTLKSDWRVNNAPFTSQIIHCLTNHNPNSAAWLSYTLFAITRFSRPNGGT